MPLNRNSSNVGCLGLLVPNKTRQEPKILRVGSDGCIYDQHGILHGRLTAGVLKYCVGREVNHDGLVIDRKGRLLGIVQTIKQLESKKPAAQSAAQSEKLSVEGHEDVSREFWIDKVALT